MPDAGLDSEDTWKIKSSLVPFLVELIMRKELATDQIIEENYKLVESPIKENEMVSITGKGSGDFPHITLSFLRVEDRVRVKALVSEKKDVVW